MVIRANYCSSLNTAHRGVLIKMRNQSFRARLEKTHSVNAPEEAQLPPSTEYIQNTPSFQLYQSLAARADCLTT